jgi:hypothetical protein
MRRPDAPAPYAMCIIAALPPLTVGWGFHAFAEGGDALFGANAQDLTAALQMEFLAIHATAFLCMFGLGQDTKLGRTIAFWGLFAGYAALAYASGTKYFVLFVGTTLVTYLGMFLNWRSATAMMQLGARWFVAFTLFLYSTHYYGASVDIQNWTSDAQVMAAGRFYFIGLGVAELTGFYLRWIPRHGELFMEAIRRMSPRF